MAKQTQTPWLDLAVALIAQGAKALAAPRNTDTAVARSLGFENAEHEVLVFLSSSWCEDLMEVILGPGSDNDRTQMGLDECVQAALDRVYGVDQVSVVCRQTPAEFVRRKGRRKRIYYPYCPVGHDIIDRYEAIILAERKETAQKKVNKIVIELHGLEKNDGAICNA